jgi:hypothetical protein
MDINFVPEYLKEDIDKTEYNRKMFPEWLEKQPDFQKIRSVKGNFGVNDIFKL